MPFTNSKDTTKISYDVTGSGPALIFVYGATCFKDFFPIKQDIKHFAKYFTVYSYDRRGRGDTTLDQGWSIEKEVQDIEALIDLAGGHASVYGHSSGAVLALEAAERLGHKILCTAIYDASYVSDEREKAEYYDLKKTVETLLARRLYAQATKKFMAGIGMPSAFVWLLPLMPGWRRMRQIAPTLMHDIALTEDFPPLENFRSIRTPVLIMVGGKSPATLHATAKVIADALPNSTAVTIEGQGHMVSTKVLLPQLRDFYTHRVTPVTDRADGEKTENGMQNPQS